MTDPPHLVKHNRGVATVLERAAVRQRSALALLDSLAYLERWGRLGRAELVGSVRHGLVVARDIDVEVTVPALDPRAAFAVAGEVAASPCVVRALYRNQSESHGWLYWEISARAGDGEEWTIETYVSGPDDRYAGWSAELATALEQALTDENRVAILTLKEALVHDAAYRAMDVYRAVVDGGVRTLDEFAAWRETSGSSELVRWRPVRR
jgi:hypothetical protein